MVSKCRTTDREPHLMTSWMCLLKTRWAVGIWRSQSGLLKLQVTLTFIVPWHEVCLFNLLS